MSCARRCVLPLACVAVICAVAQAQGVRVKLPAWQEPVLLDSMRQEHQVAGAPEAVYSAVLKTLVDLGIPIGNTDNKAGIIGSEKFERMRQLAGAPMSRSFSCGESATGPNADAFRLSIAIVAWVKPGKDGGTTLALAAAASGAEEHQVATTDHTEHTERTEHTGQRRLSAWSACSACSACSAVNYWSA